MLGGINITAIERKLYEYQGIKKRIGELEKQIDEMTQKKKSIYDKLLGAVPTDRERVMGGSWYDPIVDAVTQLVDVYADQIKWLSSELAGENAKLAQIDNLVSNSGLVETEQRYIRLRYFDGLAAWRVAQELGYSESQALRIKNATIKKMEDYEGFLMVI